MEEKEKKCKMCDGEVDGYKCDNCGEESETHNPAHACGGERCVSKCATCSEAESKCTC